jgi:hypothetical protein
VRQCVPVSHVTTASTRDDDQGIPAGL